jgi:hypothetical protein
MLDKISEYFEKNKLLVILIVSLFLLILILLYRKNYNEHMDGSISNDPLMVLPKCDPNTDQTFYKEFVGPSKLINFKCKHNGREYYLASIQKTECYISNPTSEIPQQDCNLMLILMDKEDIEKELAQYNRDIENDMAICNFKKNLECVQNNRSEEANCPKEYQECISKRLFIHDFIVTEVIQSPTVSGIPPRRKYLIKGFAKPLRNGELIDGIINQALFEDFGINHLCVDKVFYPADSGKTRYSEVIVAEKTLPVSQNIIGGASNNIVNLMMVSQEFIMGVDPETKQPVVNKLNDQTGNPRLKLTYFAVCDPNKTCTYKAKQYPRVCLVEDQLDPRVLNFEPILAGSYSV